MGGPADIFSGSLQGHRHAPTRETAKHERQDRIFIATCTNGAFALLSYHAQPLLNQPTGLRVFAESSGTVEIIVASADGHARQIGQGGAGVS
jgi:hypothetical protein